ncbi:hypothetical protein C8R44DRAFT_851913 [Mycena epipterygia]|nr:hypothetical protein C8R44DRAFT_851913 [Mycena epipterygia]
MCVEGRKRSTMRASDLPSPSIPRGNGNVDLAWSGLIVKPLLQLERDGARAAADNVVHRCRGVACMDPIGQERYAIRGITLQADLRFGFRVETRIRGVQIWGTVVLTCAPRPRNCTLFRPWKHNTSGLLSPNLPSDSALLGQLHGAPRVYVYLGGECSLYSSSTE